MTIYTKAAYTTTSNICDGGLERTMAKLDELGITLQTKVSLQLILKELGLSDTLFSFCKVCKGCEKEAQEVLYKYMTQVAGMTCQLIMLTHPQYGFILQEANKALNKRFKGLDRKPLLKRIYDQLRPMQEAEQAPHIRHWLKVYLCMLADRPDHLCAAHASVSFMDGGEILNAREELHDKLVATLSDLLGPIKDEDLYK